ncbi:MAG: TetR/AcrR family transcriptional regulator [Chloroflexota bacterium]|nr:TetR/AcrR family transcriptional regulator [Chloroflexota bacterium]
MPKQTFFNLPEEKRQLIVDIAIDEFAQNDYANVSISRIVARAGIAKGSFYQYFEDKQDLFGYLFDLIVETKSEMFSLDHPDPKRVGIFSYMRWLLETSLQFEARYPRFSQIGYRMLKDGSQAEAMVARARAGSRQFYRQLVALGKAQGDIASDIDEELAAFIFDLFISDLGRYMLQRVTAERGSDWQGQQPFFEFPEVRATYEQALRILEFGMSTNGQV